MANKTKSNNSLQKRFRVTATGKIKHQKCGKRHLNAHIRAKRKRQLQQPAVIEGPVARKYIAAMGG